MALNRRSFLKAAAATGIVVAHPLPISASSSASIKNLSQRPTDDKSAEIGSQVAGVVVSIDTSARQIELDRASVDLPRISVIVSDTAQILFDSTATIADISLGDLVLCTASDADFDPNGDQLFLADRLEPGYEVLSGRYENGAITLGQGRARIGPLTSVVASNGQVRQPSELVDGARVTVVARRNDVTGEVVAFRVSED